VLQYSGKNDSFDVFDDTLFRIETLVFGCTMFGNDVVVFLCGRHDAVDVML